MYVHHYEVWNHEHWDVWYGDDYVHDMMSLGTNAARERSQSYCLNARERSSVPGLGCHTSADKDLRGAVECMLNNHQFSTMQFADMYGMGI